MTQQLTRRQRGRLLQPVVVHALEVGRPLRAHTQKKLHELIIKQIRASSGWTDASLALEEFDRIDFENALKYAHADKQIRYRHVITRRSDGIHERMQSVCRIA